jgi:hypothetical protein
MIHGVDSKAIEQVVEVLIDEGLGGCRERSRS